MLTINTLRGPLDTRELGRTLMQEHVAIRTPGIGESWTELWDEDHWTEVAEKRLNALSSRGIGTIIDLTTADMGRDRTRGPQRGVQPDERRCLHLGERVASNRGHPGYADW